MKEATQEFHRELEQSLDIFHTVIILERYARLLQKFLCFYLPIESQLLDVNQLSVDTLIEISNCEREPITFLWVILCAVTTIPSIEGSSRQL